VSDWWARKLAGAQTTSRQLPPVAPRPVVIPQEAYPDPRSYQPEDTSRAVSKAQHTRGASYCPDCGSGNYMRPPGGGRTRCFDCGYPVVQSTSGLLADPGMKSQPAQQVQTTYNPTIEGHIG
jgi:hypothetical protein